MFTSRYPAGPGRKPPFSPAAGARTRSRATGLFDIHPEQQDRGVFQTLNWIAASPSSSSTARHWRNRRGPSASSRNLSGVTTDLVFCLL